MHGMFHLVHPLNSKSTIIATARYSFAAVATELFQLKH